MLGTHKRTHIHLAGGCIPITLTQTNPSFASAAFQWLPPNICFCCTKNCLFVLTITARCFSFHFSNLSKAITRFQVLFCSKLSETRSSHLLGTSGQWTPLTFQEGSVQRKRTGRLKTRLGYAQETVWIVCQTRIGVRVETLRSFEGEKCVVQIK